MALLISASVSVAAECADDPNECTPKNLCEIATALYGGNTSWSAAASKAKHVTFAQGLGMSCGVIAALDPCDSDPNECKISQLCGKATTENAGQVSWDDSAEAYVTLAKEYGLKCGLTESICSIKNTKYCDDYEICSLATNGDVSKTWDYNDATFEAMMRGLDCGVEAKKTCSAKTPEVCNVTALCVGAIRTWNGERFWTGSFSLQGYVKEAKKRGLTCGVSAKTASAKKDKCSFDQPDKCTKQQLCELSTYKYKNQWKILKNVYFKEATKRGLSCEVEAELKKTCSSETPQLCDEATICQLAAPYNSEGHYDTSRSWAKTSSLQSYVKEAKKRGLTCGVKANVSAASYGHINDSVICIYATTSKGPKTWTTTLASHDYVREAKARRLT